MEPVNPVELDKRRGNQNREVSVDIDISIGTSELNSSRLVVNCLQQLTNLDFSSFAWLAKWNFHSIKGNLSNSLLIICCITKAVIETIG